MCHCTPLCGLASFPPPWLPSHLNGSFAFYISLFAAEGILGPEENPSDPDLIHIPTSNFGVPMPRPDPGNHSRGGGADSTLSRSHPVPPPHLLTPQLRNWSPHQPSDEYSTPAPSPEARGGPSHRPLFADNRERVLISETVKVGTGNAGRREGHMEPV